jgi:predicted Rossmann-fold nucleotide-binding protein
MYWQGLIDWAADQLVPAGKIDEAELALLHVVDDPDEVCRIVVAAYAKQATLPPR